MELYFNQIQKEVDQCYSIAEQARQKGLDSELYVESPQAKDLAGRVEKLIGPKGVAEVIRELKVNGLKHQDYLTPGKYAEIISRWKNNDVIEIDFKMEPILLRSDPRIKTNRSKVAISIGPLIYCLEQWDNDDFDLKNLTISKSPNLKVQFEPELLDGINLIQGKTKSKQIFTAIPYYAWWR